MYTPVKPLLFVLLAVGLGLGQTTSLQVSSATGAPGSTVPLSITLTSVGGAQPAALQWDLVTGTGASAVSAVAGGAGVSAGKSIQCSGARCLLYGGNTNVMSNGVAVILNVTLSSTASGNIPIQLQNLSVSSVSGSAVQASSQAGTISVTQFVSVSVSPSTVTLSANQTQQFAATVTGSGNTAVTWSMSPSVGTISNMGLYTAPAGITTQQSVTVTATSVADGSKCASATVMLVPAVNVTVSPASATLAANQTQQFTANVTGGPGNTAVSWSVSPSVGAISNTGLYTAPASITTQQTVTVKATSVADGTKSANAAVTLQAPASGLVAAYAFNEGTGTTVADASGKGFTGTIRNAVWTTAGKYGNALVFNGSNALVTIPNAAALQLTTAMTLEAWVNPSKVTSSWRDVIYKGNDNYYLEGTTPTKSAPAIGGTYGGTNMDLYSATALTPRTWIHLAATYDGATVRLYVNGTQASSAARTGSLTTSTNPLQIGGDNIYGQYFNGTIDEIRIYNVALTQAQIQSDMNTPISSLAPAQQIISGVTTGRPTGPMAMAQRANLSTAGLSQIRTGNSGISCAPKAVTAGGQAKCTIQMVASPNSTQVRLESSNEQVRVPSVVATRANQSSLTFLASVAPDTKLQAVTIVAALADGQVEDSILALPSDGPVLSTPTKQFAKFGGQVSFTVGVADPSGLPVQVAADGVPSGASFDPATNEFTWVPRASQRGQYRVVFTATNTAHQRSTAQVRIDVDSGKPELTDSPQVACSPNAIASVTGKWLSTIDRTVSEPSGRALQLGGTQVRINGEAAPILSSSPTKVSFLCPSLTPGTRFSLVIDTDAGSIEPLNSTMQEVSPRILPVDDSGRQGLIVFPETGDMAVARNAKVPGHPAQPGDRLVVWSTGLGLPEQITAGTVQVRVGTVYANVDGVVSANGMAGLYGVAFRVPSALNFGDAVPVELRVLPSSGHPTDSNEVTASIEPVRP